MLLLWLASAGVQISGRRSVLKLAAGLSATGAGMQAAAGAEGLQQAADVYQNFDRALVAKQREVAAPLVDAKQRGDAKMVEQAKKFDATMEKLNNCQVFRPVGDGGGCALTNGQKVFAFSDVLCHNCEGALGPGSKERRVSLADFTQGGKWVVLWFFPEGGLFGGGNEAEAVQFERMLGEFAALDAVVVGCSTQSAAEQRRSLVAPRKLTFPFLSDAGRAARACCNMLCCTGRLGVLATLASWGRPPPPLPPPPKHVATLHTWGDPPSRSAPYVRLQCGREAAALSLSLSLSLTLTLTLTLTLIRWWPRPTGRQTTSAPAQSGRPSSSTPPAACAASMLEMPWAPSSPPPGHPPLYHRSGGPVGAAPPRRPRGGGPSPCGYRGEAAAALRCLPKSTVAPYVTTQEGRLSFPSACNPLHLCFKPSTLHTQALAGGQHRVRHRRVQRREPPSPRAAKL
jgi:peroxiredoxin